MSGLTAPPADGIERAGRRREIAGTAAIVLLLATLAAGRPIARRLGGHPSLDACHRLLERYAELEAIARAPDSPQSDAAEARVSPPHRPIPDADVARCARELTQNEADCALEAPNADAFERCLP